MKEMCRLSVERNSPRSCEVLLIMEMKWLQSWDVEGPEGISTEGNENDTFRLGSRYCKGVFPQKLMPRVNSLAAVRVDVAKKCGTLTWKSDVPVVDVQCWIASRIVGP